MSHDDRTHVMLIVTAEVTARVFVRGYAEYLARNGFRVTLVADDLSTLRGELSRVGVSARSVPMKREPSPWSDLISLKAMCSLIRAERPEVVFYATPKASLLGALSSLILRSPVRIYGLWGLRFETAKGFRRAVLRAMERVTAAASSSVLANSRSLADEAVRSGIVSTQKVRVLGYGSSHGVDIEHFAPDAEMPRLDDATARYLSQGDGIVVGFVGRLHPDKGVDTLLNAVSQLRQDGRSVRTLLVGADEGALQVPDHAADVTRAVHLVGETRDVRPYLRVLDVLVLVSRREGFPNVVLEAASMGVPAIVADSTGTVDSVVHGVTGLITPVGDVSALAAALSSVSRDRLRAAAMGASARLRAVEHYNQERVWSLNATYITAERQRRKKLSAEAPR